MNQPNKKMQERDKLPKVFIGSPYDGRSLPPLRKVFKDIPFQNAFAADFLRNMHLLKICEELINWADFCIFDVSNWNPNVTLELGMAQGLGKDYYIICNSRRSRSVPSDIKGIQRLTFSSYELLNNKREINKSGLWYKLMTQIGNDRNIISPLWDRFDDTKIGQKQRLYAARILSTLRLNSRIKKDQLNSLYYGLGLNKNARHRTLVILKQRNLIKENSKSISKDYSFYPPKYK